MNDLSWVDAETHFGIRLRELRQRRGWTQQEVVQRLADHGLVLHQTAIARIETAARPVRLNEALTLAAVLGVDLPGLLAPSSHNVEIAELEEYSHALTTALLEARYRVEETARQVTMATHALAQAEAVLDTARKRQRSEQQQLQELEMSLAEASMRLSEARDQFRAVNADSGADLIGPEGELIEVKHYQRRRSTKD